jgi:hypothetical protein
MQKSYQATALGTLQTLTLWCFVQTEGQLVTRVWQKWRFSAPQTHLWLIKVWCSASTFVVKIATFAKPENVSTHPKKPTRPTINEQKKEIQMPTLRKIKRAVFPTTSRPKTAHLILPNTPKHC